MSCFFTLNVKKSIRCYYTVSCMAIYANNIDYFTRGTSGDDNIYGTDFSNYIYGYDGNDVIFGLGGIYDDIIAGNGNDVVLGGSGSDIIVGGNGNDLLSGSNDNDTLFGNGNSRVIGQDNDYLSGGSGNDVLWADYGEDTLSGDLGADRFRLPSLFNGIDIITDFNRLEGDKIEISVISSARSISDFSYNKNTGALSLFGTQIATLENKPTDFSTNVDIQFSVP